MHDFFSVFRIYSDAMTAFCHSVHKILLFGIIFDIKLSKGVKLPACCATVLDKITEEALITRRNKVSHLRRFNAPVTRTFYLNLRNNFFFSNETSPGLVEALIARCIRAHINWYGKLNPLLIAQRTSYPSTYKHAPTRCA